MTNTNKDRRLGSGDFKVTTEQISNWVGNVRLWRTREHFFLSVILDVANGKYPAEELNCDIRCYEEIENE